MSEFVKCEKCGGEMKVIDAHHDSECFQTLLDWECVICGAGYSETCPDYDDEQDDDDWDESDQ
ncbi:MAG: hypothetical protein IT320_17245 [Anaerolineae bacterium]|nr:hypothetical protein [Anaerolineae bacterium]